MFEQMRRMGILAMPGRQCCDKSERPPDGRPLPVDNQVLPIPWRGDDVMPWPGEHLAPTAVPRPHLHGATPVVTLSGWNAARQTAPRQSSAKSGGKRTIQEVGK